MATITASDGMRAAHTDLEKTERLGAHLDLLGKHVAAIKARRRKAGGPVEDRLTYDPGNPAYDRYSADPRMRVAAARARLAAQGAPLQARRWDREIHPPGRPTDELIAKDGGIGAYDISIAGKGAETPLKTYVRKTPFGTYLELVPEDVRDAFKRFERDAETADMVRVTANYSGASGASRGSKTGGLGDYDPDGKRRAAYGRHVYRLRRLAEILDTPQSRVKAAMVLAWAILRERAADGRALSMAELGRKICPERADEKFARGVAYGAVEMVGRALISIDHEYQSGALRINGGGGARLRGAARAYAEAGVSATQTGMAVR